MSEQHQETVVPDSDATIQVKGVTKRFGARVAVDNLSFDVNRGEIVGFLGPNGSGKTTTMRMLTSYYTPDIGNIAINGMDTQENDIVTREAIGYLPENNPLYEDMLVSEYLAFVAELRGLSGADRRRNLDLTVEETGIQEVFYRPYLRTVEGLPPARRTGPGHPAQARRPGIGRTYRGTRPQPAHYHPRSHPSSRRRENGPAQHPRHAGGREYLRARPGNQPRKVGRQQSGSRSSPTGFGA